MQFGIREICDVVFKAKTSGYLNKAKKLGHYVAGQPVLYIDSAKTSTMEGAATTVYAQGGRGNSRLIAWEGEKTLTFTVEDALLSEIGFAILSGAQLINAGDQYGPEGAQKTHKVYAHNTTRAQIGDEGEIDLSDVLGNDVISATSPIFVMSMTQGSIGEKISADLDTTKKKLTATLGDTVSVGDVVFVDYYVEKTSAVTEMTIDAENFAGYYYVEASTLFRRQSDGKDMPAELIFPNVKIQSNFTFSMAATGDPSTFTFTMDAMPGYTRFDKTKKVLCVMNIIDDSVAATETSDTDSAGNKADAEADYPLA